MSHQVPMRIVAFLALIILTMLPAAQLEAAPEAAVPALTIGAAADRAEIGIGDEIAYTLTVRNVGQARASSLTLAAQLPGGLTFVNGSASVNGQALPNLSATPWPLPNLEGDSALTVRFRARAQQAKAGTAYTANFSIAGRDSLGKNIPANQSALVPADTDRDDRTEATVYGPLEWDSTRMIVAFEDLKKFAWTDWDYNDFVVRIEIRRGTTGKDDLAAVEVRYEALARGAGFLNHTFRHEFPFSGGGWYNLVVSDPSGAPVLNEQAGFENDNPDIAVFSRTRQALPQPNDAMEQTNTRPEQQGVIAGRTATLTIALNEPQKSNSIHLRLLPWDAYLHVVESGQEVHLLRPGRLDNTQTVTNLSDSTSPLIGYDLPLARIFPDTWRWPSETMGIWRGYPDFSKYIQTGGRGGSDWDLDQYTVPGWLWGGVIPEALPALPAEAETPESRYFAAPLVADLNGDGEPEIIIGNLLANRLEVYDTHLHPLPGWPQPIGGGVRAAATVADLDGDGEPEIIVGAGDGKLYAWHADGTALAGWPVSVGVEQGTPYRILGTPAIADLTGNFNPEIVIPLADGRLYAFTSAGQLLPGWPVSIGDVKDVYGSQILNSSPRIADLEGDGTPEIIVGSVDAHLYVFAPDGTERWRYATGDMILSTPAVAEIDPSHTGMEVVVGSGDGSVYLLSSAGQLIWSRTTEWTIRSSPLVADLNADASPEILIGGDDMKLWAWHANGDEVAGWPQETGAELFGAPVSGDIDGDGQPEIIIGGEDAQIYAWNTDGSPVAGWPKPTYLAVKGAPTLINLDEDAALELVAGDMSGTLYIVGRLEQAYLPILTRP